MAFRVALDLLSDSYINIGIGVSYFLMSSREAVGSTPRVSYRVLGLTVSTLSLMSPTSKLLALLSCCVDRVSALVEGRGAVSGTALAGEVVAASFAFLLVLPEVSPDVVTAGSAF